jgi:hypothetical protein
VRPPARSITTCATSCRPRGSCGSPGAQRRRARASSPHHPQHHRPRHAAGQRRHQYVRDRPIPRITEFDLAGLIDEVGITLREQGQDSDQRGAQRINALGGERRVRADRDLLYRVFVNLGRSAFVPAPLQ